VEHLASPHPDCEGQFSLIVVEQFEEIPTRLQMTSPYFGLLVAIDFAGDSPDLRDAIGRLITQGLAYFSSWGGGCEAMHDLVDRVDRESGHFNPNTTEDDVLMTVWNSNRTLEETMWDFAYASCPAERYINGCKSYIIAAQLRYANQIRSGWAVATLPK
jgi:hypothetical protein